MAQLTIAIIDDDKKDLAMINENINHLLNEFDCQSQCSLFLGHDELPERQFNIYFIDIDMQNISGFDLCRNLASKFPTSKMVFCTSHNDLVFNAFELSTFYFVRKDHLVEDLRKAFKKYFKSGCFSLFDLSDRRKIPLSNIAYFEVSRNDLTIVLTDGKTIETRKTLKSALEQIPSDTFVQISKFCAVNLSFIQTIYRLDCILKNGKNLQISRSRKTEVMKTYDLYLANLL